MVLKLPQIRESTEAYEENPHAGQWIGWRSVQDKKGALSWTLQHFKC
jgi:hypothetical protein